MPCDNVMTSARESYERNRLLLFQSSVDICNHCRDDSLSAEKVLCLEGKCDQWQPSLRVPQGTLCTVFLIFYTVICD